MRFVSAWMVGVFLAAGISLPGAVSAAPALDANYGVGSWIWDHQTYDRQECRFWKSFEIPRGVSVKSATLRITADNFYFVFLDGQPVGQGADWRVLIEYDLSQLLESGTHVLAVDVSNDFDVAGLLVGLHINLADGSVIEIASDDTWKIAPRNVTDWKQRTRAPAEWPSAKVLYPFRPEDNKQIYQAPVSQPVVISFWQRRWFQISTIILCVLAAACSLFLFSRLILKSRMERMVRRERARIAADLHDSLGGGLTQLVILGDASKRVISNGSVAVDTLDRLCDQTRNLVRGMNEAVWLINSQRDNLRDFASYLGKHAELFFHDTPVRCRFEIEKNLPALPCDISVRRNLFLAVKEAFTNVLRHSGATEVRLGVRQERNGIRIIISDNGRGFDPSAVDGEGNGLANMKHRAAEVAGTFGIQRGEEGGCTVTLGAPLQFKGSRKSLRKTSRTNP
ncbi:ATP-binding protein [Luteolibacter sp.]